MWKQAVRGYVNDSSSKKLSFFKDFSPPLFFCSGRILEMKCTVDGTSPRLCKHGFCELAAPGCLTVRSCHIRKWIMLTYGWKQRWIGLLCNAMKNHALQQRRGARAVPLSPSWQVCSVTWQLSISMINAVVLGLPFTELKSVLLQCFKVKWMSRNHTDC